MNESGQQENSDLSTVFDNKTAIKRPQNYKALLHNDDYTTMEFVVYILKSVFKKNTQMAKQIMLDVHNQGAGVCGTYSFEIAETKMIKVMRLAREHGHPLRCTIESED